MEEHMAYVAYCKCGKLIFACVDNTEHVKDTAKEVSKIIKDGFSIHRISCEAVRQGPWCTNHGNCG